jgi:hypothetical protein
MVSYFSYEFQNKEFVKQFVIGKFSYAIYKERKFLHDDNLNADFFGVYKLRTAKRLCSSYMIAKRNDSTFIKGNYLIYNDKIEFTEWYYYRSNSLWIDSVKKIFYPKKNGDLFLKEAIQFKNGKSKIITNK